MDLMRIGMFWADIPMTEAHVKVCKEVVFLSCRCMHVFYACIIQIHKLRRRHLHVWAQLVEKGGDWERRNKLKVYQATYLMSIRDFKKAASLLLDSISTFTATELYSYKQVHFLKNSASSLDVQGDFLLI